MNEHATGATATRYIVNSLWCGETLSWVARACLKSFVKHGHDTRLYAYQAIDNVPDNVTVLDGRDILPEESQFQFDGVMAPGQIGSFGPFSDYFRYQMMANCPGTWVDSDMYCVRPFDFTEPYIFAKESADRDSAIGNAVLRFPGDSDMRRGLLEALTPPYEMPAWIGPHKKKAALEKLDGEPFHPGRMTYAAYGPAAITHFARKSRVARYAMHKRTFYPVHFTKTRRFERMPYDVESVLHKDTYAVHLWYSQLKQWATDAPPEGSFLHRLWLEGNADGDS